MIMDISQMDKQISGLQKKKEDAITESKKTAAVDVKTLILDFKLTKNDLRGKAIDGQ